jgi:4,5-DOPA dioxygenase extradiol
MYPDADIPVIQLSLDNNLSPQDHFQIGQELKPLREDGVLILGSGNIVHNLRMLNFQSNDPYPWATEFDALISQDIMNKNYQGLIDYSQYSASAIAVPTNEHYLPLLYAAGASDDQTPEFFNIGYYAGSIGMRSLIYR